jgi:hypothetical protein
MNNLARTFIVTFWEKLRSITVSVGGETLASSPDTEPRGCVIDIGQVSYRRAYYIYFYELLIYQHQ